MSSGCVWIARLVDLADVLAVWTEDNLIKVLYKLRASLADEDPLDALMSLQPMIKAVYA